MLRCNLLPSPSPAFCRFSSSACFALPLLQQNFSFASTKSKVTLGKRKGNRGKKIDFSAVNISSSEVESCFDDTFRILDTDLMRAREAWRLAKRSRGDSLFVLKASAAFLKLPYAPRSKMKDFAAIQLLFPHDFLSVSRIYISRVYSKLQKDLVAAAPDQQETTPLPVSQLQKLIGNTKLMTSFDRAIFQQWVLGCKVSDLHRQQRVFFPKHNIVLIRQQRLTGTSFIRYVPSTKEQFERIWRTSGLKMSKNRFHKSVQQYINKKLKSSAFTPGSIPQGSIKFLRDRGVPEREITNITGRGSIHLSLRGQAPFSLENEAPRQQNNSITKLIKAIFPDGKY